MFFQIIGRLASKIPEKLLLSILIVNFLLVIVYGGFLKFYNYDDYVVTTVALQPFSQFWDTLQSEPHPPGFYLLIKLISRFLPPPILLKMTLTGISYMLLAFSIIFASKKKLIERYKLRSGLAIFFCSFGFLEITNYIKQDILTFPLFFSYLFYILSKVSQKKISTREWVCLHLGAIPIFFLGYIYYAQAVAILLVFAMYQIFLNKNLAKYISSFFLIQIILITIYGLLFEFNQLHTNLDRFGWVARQNNDLLSNLSAFLTGASPHQLITDISVLGFVLLVFLAVSKEIKRKHTFRFFFIFLSTSILLFTYGFNLFSQTRYSILFFLCASVIAGWGMEFVRQKWIQILIFFLLFSFRTTLFIKGHNVLLISFSTFLQSLDTTISQETEPVGLIASAPSAPQYLKLQFFRKNSNIQPINASHTELYKEDTFTKDDLYYLDYVINLSKEEVKDNLSSTGLHRFIYIFLDDSSYHDPQKQVPNVLIENCTLKQITPITSTNSMIYSFEHCFESNP